MGGDGGEDGAVQGTAARVPAKARPIAAKAGPMAANGRPIGAKARPIAARGAPWKCHSVGVDEYDEWKVHENQAFDCHGDQSGHLPR